MAEKSGTGRCLGIQMDIVASSASQRGDRNSSKGSQKFTRVDEKLLAKVPQPVRGNLASRGGSSARLDDEFRGADLALQPGNK